MRNLCSMQQGAMSNIDYLINLITESIVDEVSFKLNEKIEQSFASLKVPNRQDEENELMSVPETLKCLFISRATLSKWTREGKIKSYKIGGKLYYKKETLLKNLRGCLKISSKEYYSVRAVV
jgi:hypothetical protein